MLADRGLAFLGQQQPAQAAGGIGKRRRHRMVAVEPHGALRCVRRGAGRVILALALRWRGKPLGRRIPRRARLKFATRAGGMRGRLSAGPGTIGARTIGSGTTWARTIVPGFRMVAMTGIARLVAAAGTATRFGSVNPCALAPRALARRSRSVTACSAIGPAIGGGTGGPAGTIAMRGFHCPQL